MLNALYPWIKSLHLIAVVAWMAGMMYLPRLYVYHHQAEAGGEAERFFITMERRLLKGIMNPAMIATWLLGILLIVAIPAYAGQIWFIVKFVGVIAISAMHGIYAKAYRGFAAGDRPKSERYWRIANEVPFIALIVIVFMVILKPFVG